MLASPPAPLPPSANLRTFMAIARIPWYICAFVIGFDDIVVTAETNFIEGVATDVMEHIHKKLPK